MRLWAGRTYSVILWVIFKEKSGTKLSGAAFARMVFANLYVRVEPLSESKAERCKNSDATHGLHPTSELGATECPTEYAGSNYIAQTHTYIILQYKLYCQAQAIKLHALHSVPKAV